MNAKRIGLGIVLADFAALNAYVVYRHGYVGFFQLALANVATVAIFVDLVIALSLVMAWMWRDARANGRAFLPYAVLTLLFGSIGPLTYLVTATDTRSSAVPTAAGTRVEMARVRS